MTDQQKNKIVKDDKVNLAQQENFLPLAIRSGRNAVANVSACLLQTSSKSFPTRSDNSNNSFNKIPRRVGRKEVQAHRCRPRRHKQNRPKSRKRPDHLGPGRPLSAYNIFFRDERRRWLAEQQHHHQQQQHSSTATGCHSHDEPVNAFYTLGKEMARRWKALDSASMAHYKELAARDMERYQRERQEQVDRVTQEAVQQAATLQQDVQQQQSQQQSQQPDWKNTASKENALAGHPQSAALDQMTRLLQHGPPEQLMVCATSVTQKKKTLLEEVWTSRNLQPKVPEYSTNETELKLMAEAVHCYSHQSPTRPLLFPLDQGRTPVDHVCDALPGQAFVSLLTASPLPRSIPGQKADLGGPRQTVTASALSHVTESSALLCSLISHLRAPTRPVQQTPQQQLPQSATSSVSSVPSAFEHWQALLMRRRFSSIDDRLDTKLPDATCLPPPHFGLDECTLRSAASQLSGHAIHPKSLMQPTSQTRVGDDDAQFIHYIMSLANREASPRLASPPKRHHANVALPPQYATLSAEDSLWLLEHGQLKRSPGYRVPSMRRQSHPTSPLTTHPSPSTTAALSRQLELALLDEIYSYRSIPPRPK